MQEKKILTENFKKVSKFLCKIQWEFSVLKLNIATRIFSKNKVLSLFHWEKAECYVQASL